jgi:hypothetical protein
MLKITIARSPAVFVLLFITLCLMACSPKYNWREVRGKDGRFVVLMPDKPVTMTRDLTLDGAKVAMTMTAAEVDGVNFAVGYVDVADATRASAVLQSMKTAMIANINGSLKPTSSDADIEVIGHRNGDANKVGGEALLLLGHFESKDKRIYQVIVLGNQKAIIRDEAKTFFSSLRLN